MASNGNRKVLVTGATGMIGRQVCSALQKTSYGVVRAQVRERIEARERVGNVFDFALAEIEQFDFTLSLEHDYAALTKGCSAVIHAAGLVHCPNAPYQEYEVMNVRATRQLAEAAAANNVDTFIFLSSSAVYGQGPFNKVTESDPTPAVTPYAVSKLTSEKFLESFTGLRRTIVLRPSMVFGEGDRGNLLKMIQEIDNERYKHIGDGQTQKSVIYTKDLAQAILLCLSRVQRGYHVFNVSNPEPVTIKELAESIATGLGKEKKIASVPTGLLKFGVKAAEMFMPGKAPISSEQVEKLTTDTTCSVEKFVKTTGFRPKSTLTGAVKAEIDWAREQNLLPR